MPMTFDDIMMLRAQHLAHNGQKPDQKGPGLKGAMQRRMTSKKGDGPRQPDPEAQQMMAPPVAPQPPPGASPVGGPQGGEEPNPMAFHRKLPPDIAALARRYGRM